MQDIYKDLMLLEDEQEEETKDIIYDELYSLTHLYQDNEDEIIETPWYCMLETIASNYGYTTQEMINFAKDHDYIVFKISPIGSFEGGLAIGAKDVDLDMVKENIKKMVEDDFEETKDIDVKISLKEDIKEYHFDAKSVYDAEQQLKQLFKLSKELPNDDGRYYVFKDIDGNVIAHYDPQHKIVHVSKSIKESKLDDLHILKYKYCVEVVDRDNNFMERKFFMTRPQADKYIEERYNDILFDERISQNELVELDNGKDFIGTLIKVVIENPIEAATQESIKEEWMQVPDEELERLEKQIEELGFKVVSKQPYAMSKDIHYQILTKEGNQDEDSFNDYIDKFEELLDTFEEETGAPCTFNMGLQYDGYISCGFDVREMWYEPGEDRIPSKSTKLSFRDGKPADEYTKAQLKDIGKHLQMPDDEVANIFPTDKHEELKEEKEDYQKKFDERTQAHIDRVNKYAKKIDREYPNHDSDKFNELYDGYSLMSKDNVSEEEQALIDDATFKHVRDNEHHCEHWVDEKDIEGFSRNSPTPHGCLDCSKMPESALEEMCCDWCAMSEEFNNTPFEWYEKNKDTRWHFSEEQDKFILDTLHKLWDEAIEEDVKRHSILIDEPSGKDVFEILTNAKYDVRKDENKPVLTYIVTKDNKEYEVDDYGYEDDKFFVDLKWKKDLEEEIEKQYKITIGKGQYQDSYVVKAKDDEEAWQIAKEHATRKGFKDYDVEEYVKEDIEKHDTLNQKLFDGEELKPEVVEAIKNIANEFVKELGEDGISFTLKDIILLGSNMSYNYTKDSDLDIHLIADSSALECPKELQDKLYGAYRTIFNKNYDIKLKDIPAEVYVELDEPKAKSNGIYSLNNGWVKKPVQQDIPELDKEMFDELFKVWENRYNELVNDENATSEDVEEYINDIYDERKDGIANEGEYSLSNLLFKEVRNKGYLDNLKELRKELKGKELSLEHLEESFNRQQKQLLDNLLDAFNLKYEKDKIYNFGIISSNASGRENSDEIDNDSYLDTKKRFDSLDGEIVKGYFEGESEDSKIIYNISEDDVKNIGLELLQDEVLYLTFNTSKDNDLSFTANRWGHGIKNNFKNYDLITKSSVVNTTNISNNDNRSELKNGFKFQLKLYESVSLNEDRIKVTNLADFANDIKNKFPYTKVELKGNVLYIYYPDFYYTDKSTQAVFYASELENYMKNFKGLKGNIPYELSAEQSLRDEGSNVVYRNVYKLTLLNDKKDTNLINKKAIDSGYDTIIYRVDNTNGNSITSFKNSNGVFFAGDLKYYGASNRNQGVVGYHAKNAKKYYLNLRDFKVLDIFKEYKTALGREIIPDYGTVDLKEIDTHIKEALKEYDFIVQSWDSIAVSDRVMPKLGIEENRTSTNELATKLSKLGYDILILRDIPLRDKLFTEYVIYNSDCIKLAETTYDDEGNAIPVEDRFNKDSYDVRENKIDKKLNSAYNRRELDYFKQENLKVKRR